MLATRRFIVRQRDDDLLAVLVVASYHGPSCSYVATIATLDGRHENFFHRDSLDSVLAQAEEWLVAFVGPVVVASATRRPPAMRIARYQGVAVLLLGESGVQLEDDEVLGLRQLDEAGIRACLQRCARSRGGKSQGQLLMRWLELSGVDVSVLAADAERASDPNRDYDPE